MLPPNFKLPEVKLTGFGTFTPPPEKPGETIVMPMAKKEVSEDEHSGIDVPLGDGDYFNRTKPG